MSRLTATNCPLCDRVMHQPTRDHFFPKSFGGTKDWMNMWDICQPCNINKGRRLPTNKQIAKLCVVKKFPTLSPLRWRIK